MMNSYASPGLPCGSGHIQTIRDRLEFILNCLGGNRHDLILDIGSGFGAYANYLSRLSDSYVGIDINQGYLSTAKSSSLVSSTEFIRMSADNLAFGDNLFSVVLLIEVIEHLVYDNEVLDEVHRVLKPDGELILTAPNRLFPFETHGFRIGDRIIGSKGFGFPFLPYLPDSCRKRLTNARIYTSSRLKETLESKGFVLQNVGYLGPSFDQMAISYSRLSKVLRASSERIKNTPFSHFFPTLMIQAKKESA
jgi:2-polyprenyl-3-methyl-5-hydroxy-6-metoxy-1,4-benzoquinol methylase